MEGLSAAELGSVFVSRGPNVPAPSELITLAWIWPSEPAVTTNDLFSCSVMAASADTDRVWGASLANKIHCGAKVINRQLGSRTDSHAVR